VSGFPPKSYYTCTHVRGGQIRQRVRERREGGDGEGDGWGEGEGVMNACHRLIDRRLQKTRPIGVSRA